MSAVPSVRSNVWDEPKPPSLEMMTWVLPVGPVAVTVTFRELVNSAALLIVMPTGLDAVNDLMSPFMLPRSLLASTR